MIQQQPVTLRPQNKETDANSTDEDFARVLGREGVEETGACSTCVKTTTHTLKTRTHCLDTQSGKRLATAEADRPKCEGGVRQAI